MLIMEAWDVDNCLSSCIPITFDEMIEIDQKIWKKMGDMCLAQYGGIRPLPDGTKPLERVWPLVKNDIEVRLMLQPKKTLGSGGGGAAAKASRPGAGAVIKKAGAPGPNTDKNRLARKKKQDKLKKRAKDLQAKPGSTT